MYVYRPRAAATCFLHSYVQSQADLGQLARSVGRPSPIKTGRFDVALAELAGCHKVRRFDRLVGDRRDVEGPTIAKLGGALPLIGRGLKDLASSVYVALASRHST